MGTIDHCSSCTDRCADGLICQNNACVAGAGTTRCSGKTINSLTNIDHCGNCNNKCGEGLICSEGTCQMGNGQMYCSDVLINSTTDSMHCGGCNNLCPAGSRCGTRSGTIGCIEGTGETYCNNILIRNTTFDSANCGQCGKVCGIGEICSLGVCTAGTGKTYCNGISRNTANDSLNCGQCWNDCGVGEICTDGVCTAGTGETYCDGMSINTANDSRNCGQCGKTCSDGVSCRSGGCITTCGGISTSLMDDSANCGRCGNKCSIGELCNIGVCIPGTGETYCDGMSINTANDFFNCGQCDYNCAPNQTCHNTCTTHSVGEIISFGHYEQDNDTTNGKEPIEWRVLDINYNGQLLVISEKVLDAEPYNTTRISVTWEKSTIRSWLNGYGASYNTVGTDFTSDNFIDVAFTAEEKAKIVLSNVPAHANPNYSTLPGKATTDKIFLLSITETENYLSGSDARKADATRYAVKQGVYVYGSTSKHYSGDGTCTDVHCYAVWWLRSPGNPYNAATVRPEGRFSYSGAYVNLGDSGVRPALWVEY